MTAVPTTLLVLMPWVSAAQEIVPLGPFRSVTLRNGGRVVLRHAPTQRVTLPEGASGCTKATLEGDRLVIDRQHGRCPNRHELAVEVLTPDVEDITVMDGGTIQTVGSFPPHAELRVAVEDGGTIDLRSMAVGHVTAAVHDGGRILIRPQERLVATIARGGVVTYWGSPRVTSSVSHGGVVSRGSPADADKPLLELGVRPPMTPAVPPTRVRGTL